MQALFDTNILIDYLSGYEVARKEIEQYNLSYISIITKMEILVGIKNDNEDIVRAFLDSMFAANL